MVVSVWYQGGADSSKCHKQKIKLAILQWRVTPVSYQHFSVGEILMCDKFVDSLPDGEFACRQLGKQYKLSAPSQICSLLCDACLDHLSEAKALLHQEVDVFQHVFEGLSQGIQCVRYMLLVALPSNGDGNI